MNENSERELVDELAASLIDFMVESIEGISLDATTEAAQLLGIFDGEELVLPESFNDDLFAGELIAEALVARPEFQDALARMGALLVKRVKLCE